MGNPLQACFYKTAAGNEPVRDWLRELTREDMQRIGSDIRTVQNGWPIGMPVCRSLRDGINEVRTDLEQNRIARVLFCVKSGIMYLLHGFIKKTQKTPKDEIDLALTRKNDLFSPQRREEAK